MNRLACLLCLSFVALCLACAGPAHRPVGQSTSGATAAPAVAKQFTRAEFDRAVIGKTPREIVALAGAPSTVHRGTDNTDADSPQFSGSLGYSGTDLYIAEPLSGQRGFMLIIHFKNGLAHHIEYY